jgi:dolichyl-phosphate beta-glucosyltransferase
VFFTDADLPVKLEAVTMSLSILENNESDMVIGDRRLAGSKAIGSAPIRRHIASMVFNFGVQLLALPGYTDTQCCMKAFTKEALQKVLPETFLTSYAFDVELVYLAKLHNLRIKRIPVFWKDARANVSLKRLTHIILSSLKEVAYVRFRKR